MPPVSTLIFIWRPLLMGAIILVLPRRERKLARRIFQKPREFWVRPVRWYEEGSDYANLLLRPVGAEDSRLLLATFAFKDSRNHSHDAIDIQLPDSWQLGRKNGRSGQSGKLFSSLIRFWNQAGQDVHIGVQEKKNPVLCRRRSSTSFHNPRPWHSEPFTGIRSFTLDELADWPTPDFHDFLERHLKDENSQLHLLWNWSRLKYRERWNSFFQGPEWECFPALLKSLLQSEGLRSPDIARFGAEMSYESHHDTIKICSSPPTWLKDSVRLKEWKSALRDYFKDVKTAARVPDSVHLQAFAVLMTSCRPVSHHEILEACH